MSQNIVWTGSADFTSGSSTPFGIYDSDSQFEADAPLVADFVATRLGYPSIDIELNGKQIFSCFEEAVSEYSAQVNQFSIRNNLPQLMGQGTGSNYTGKLVEGSFLNQTIRIFGSPLKIIINVFLAIFI